MRDEELQYWIAFSKITGFGPKHFEKLYAYFDSMQTAWNAPLAELLSAGFREDSVLEIVSQRQKIDPGAELHNALREGICAVTVQDKHYPALLQEIYNPPPVLYYRGTLSHEHTALAVVGTRKLTPYGKQAALDLSEHIAREGVVIVSGLALGIDTCAHKGAIAANGITVAVIGSGLDVQNIYPSSNRYLAEQIIDYGGAIVSEYPAGTPAHPSHFPQRNRIISGLSRATLVIEAPESSGALITAKFALEQNRDVLAVPGSIYSENSSGTNALIRDGAIPVTKADDVFAALGVSAQEDIQRAYAPANEQEKEILEHISKEAVHIDALIKLCAHNPAQISATVSMLEIKGVIKHLGGGNYAAA